MTVHDTQLNKAVDWLAQSRRVAVLTGAGISAESGIPTFRDALTGLWERFEAADLATPRAFREDKALVWGWYEWRRMQMLRSEPNAGHRALVALSQRVEDCRLITQNVDDLHERAGSPDVVHLHGSLLHPRCFACGHPHVLPDGIPDEPEGGRSIQPPRCERCRGYVRPGVVWFGESLPTLAWSAAERAVRECDLFLSIGTSGQVFPAAGLHQIAAQQSKPIIVINPGELADGRSRELCLRGPAGEVLPALMARWSAIDP